jgi:hypothetical protein
MVAILGHLMGGLRGENEMGFVQESFGKVSNSCVVSASATLRSNLINFITQKQTIPSLIMKNCLNSARPRTSTSPKKRHKAQGTTSCVINCEMAEGKNLRMFDLRLET